MRTIILGPQGCGKRLRAEALKLEGAASQIVEEWDGREGLPRSCIAISNLPREQCVIPRDARVIELTARRT